MDLSTNGRTAMSGVINSEAPVLEARVQEEAFAVCSGLLSLTQEGLSVPALLPTQCLLTHPDKQQPTASVLGVLVAVPGFWTFGEGAGKRGQSFCLSQITKLNPFFQRFIFMIFF